MPNPSLGEGKCAGKPGEYPSRAEHALEVGSGVCARLGWQLGILTQSDILTAPGRANPPAGQTIRSGPTEGGCRLSRRSGINFPVRAS